MCLKNYTIKIKKSEDKPKKNTRLSYEERVIIELLYKKGLGPTTIGKELNRNKSVISREINRHKEIRYIDKRAIYVERYMAAAAQGGYTHNKKKAGRISAVKKDSGLKTFIETKVKENKWSPEEIAGYIKRNNMGFQLRPSFQEIYYWINKKQLNISSLDLTHKAKLKKRKITNKDLKEQAPSRKHKSIHIRPNIIDSNEEFGHWELDCVEGAKSTKTTYMTLLERTTKKYIVIPMKDHTSSSVRDAIDGLEKQYKDIFSMVFKTMTTDNGNEFVKYDMLEASIYKKEIRTTIYYTDPYSSWQKGMNENCNGILRRFIPKGINLAGISQYKLETIVYKINNKPRKILGFQAADVLFKKEINDIIKAV